MGWWDSIFGGATSGATNAATGGGDSWASIVPSLIAAGSSAVHDYTTPEPERDYSNTQAAFDANMAYKRDDMAQAMEIARMNAASGNAGAGATVRAAQIAAETARRALKEKAVADALGLSNDLYKTNMQGGQAAVDSAAAARANVGAMGQRGYQSAADILSRYKM